MIASLATIQRLLVIGVYSMEAHLKPWSRIDTYSEMINT